MRSLLAVLCLFVPKHKLVCAKIGDVLSLLVHTFYPFIVPTGSHFLSTYCPYWLTFPVHLSSLLVHTFCPLVVPTGSHFLSTYCPYWFTIPVHLLTLLAHTSCPLIFPTGSHFRSTYPPVHILSFGAAMTEPFVSALNRNWNAFLYFRLLFRTVDISCALYEEEGARSGAVGRGTALNVRR